MHETASLTRDRDVVPRLRRAFRRIALFTLVGIGASLVFLHRIERSETALINTALPILVETEAIEREVTMLLSRLRQTPELHDAAGFDRRQTLLADEFEALEQRVSAIKRVGADSRAVDEMASVLARLRANTGAKLDLQRALLETDMDIADRLAAMQARRQVLRRRIEDMSIVAERDLDRATAALAQAEGVGGDAVPDALAILAMRHTLGGLGARLDTLLALAQQAPSQPELAHLREAGTLVRFALRGGAQLLIKLPADRARADLAADWRALHRAATGPGGLLEMTALRAGRLAEAARFETIEAALVGELAGKAATLLDSAVTQFREALAAVEGSVSQTVITLAAAFLGVLGVILWTSVFVIERQINRRMARLTAAMMDVAQGNHRRRVRVRGSDELGRMARALETFRQNALQLHQSNADLEKFAYVAAHDLRAPLRAIRDLADWTIEDSGPELSDQSRENLALLMARIDRMSRLLGDLLTYARAGEDKGAMERAHLHELSRQVFDLTDARDRFNLSVEGNAQELATVVLPLQQILLNLFDNASKHHDRHSGLIEVEFTLSRDRMTVRVSDDGPGIPARFHDRVFELFQTLRPRDEVEASGLGLAIVSKLVKRHGGRVSIEQATRGARGTTVIFDLPAARVPAQVQEAA